MKSLQISHQKNRSQGNNGLIKEGNYQPRIVHPAKLPLKEKNRNIYKQVITKISALKELLKDMLEEESNGPSVSLKCKKERQTNKS